MNCVSGRQRGCDYARKDGRNLPTQRVLFGRTHYGNSRHNRHHYNVRYHIVLAGKLDADCDQRHWTLAHNPTVCLRMPGINTPSCSSPKGAFHQRRSNLGSAEPGSTLIVDLNQVQVMIGCTIAKLGSADVVQLNHDGYTSWTLIGSIWSRSVTSHALFTLVLTWRKSGRK